MSSVRDIRRKIATAGSVCEDALYFELVAARRGDYMSAADWAEIAEWSSMDAFFWANQLLKEQEQ